jgi:hypothetical protein
MPRVLSNSAQFPVESVLLIRTNRLPAENPQLIVWDEPFPVYEPTLLTPLRDAKRYAILVAEAARRPLRTENELELAAHHAVPVPDALPVSFKSSHLCKGELPE